MRTFIMFFLAFLLPFNAAIASMADICEAAERTRIHAVHLGHFAHDLDDTGGSSVKAFDETSGVPDGDGLTPHQAGHQHCHVHLVFASQASCSGDLSLPKSVGVHSPARAEAFTSAISSLLERPPRALRLA